MPLRSRKGAPLLILLTGLGFAALVTALTYSVQRDVAQVEFAARADRLANRLHDRISDHIALLQATAAAFEAQGRVMEAPDFTDYVARLDLLRHYRGIQGIGYAALTPAAAVAAANAALARDYGPEIRVHPDPGAGVGTPIMLLAPPNDRNTRALGYDMFSEARRRAAMVQASATGQATATAPLELVQEITGDKQPGFLIYVPVHLGAASGDDAVSGFVYAPFRAHDLHRAALDLAGPGGAEGLEGLVLRSFDAEAPGGLLFQSGGTPWVEGRPATQRRISIGGRDWIVQVQPATRMVAGMVLWPTLVIGGLSALLALAAMGLARAWQRRLAQTQAAADLARRTADERRLLLHEMKHRIKNHIARIQAIARLSMRQSDSLPAFDALFGGRLRAMAEAQDLVSGTGQAAADLRRLVGVEISQIYGSDRLAAALDGPPVQLDERQAQAIGLVIHELTTNAMKYGGSDEATPRIAVGWRRLADGRLQLDWHEPDARPAPMPRGAALGQS